MAETLSGLYVRMADEPAARWAGALLGALGAHCEAGRADHPGADEQVRLLTAGFESAAAPASPIRSSCEVYGEVSGPGRDWARSGGMWLTGRPGGPPLPAPGAPATAMRGALLAVRVLSALGWSEVRLDGRELLGERAALAGLRRAGDRSPGGGTRLLPTVDGWLALSLARQDDLDAVPALVEGMVDTDPWRTVAEWAGHRGAADAAERAHLLGMAAAPVPAQGTKPGNRTKPTQGTTPGNPEPFVLGPPGSGQGTPRRPLVVDLSSLWAGPLCAHLLGLAGARVVKVESPDRPDGARAGEPRLFDLLHGGHESVAIDFRTTAGNRALRELIGAADLVLEASRARAMRQLGIDVTEPVRAGTTWLSITAYGRASDRIGFGDDVAAGAGLVAKDPDSGAPLLCGDALADPLTGAHAAVAALACLLEGRGRLVEVPMHNVASAARHRLAGRTDPALPVAAPPVARTPCAAAPPLGRDTAAVLAEVAP